MSPWHSGASVSSQFPAVTTLKRNIFANLAGGAWVAVLTLVITPLQINLLGMEGYGLLGFIMILQLVVSVLDLGLSSTITREFAGDGTPGKQASQFLLRTALTLYWGMAVLIGVALCSISGLLAAGWFRASAVEVSVLERGLQVAAIYLALRWPVALYSGVLAGIQRMDALNLAKVGAISLRLLGGIVVLLVWHDLMVFLVWNVFSAAVEVLIFATVCRRLLPGMDWRPGFSMGVVGNIWSFSLSMSALSILGMGITQLDRLLISNMMPLQSLGYYSLAYSTATAISLVLSSVSSALMPSFAVAHAENAWETLLRRYDNASRIMLFTTGLVLFSLLFFGESLLSVWVSPDAAAGAWRSLALLAGGFWLSAAVSSAYNVAVACRQPGRILRISAVSALIYAPILYWLISRWGIDGAAAAWLLLNAGYVLVIIPAVHRAILDIPVLPWFFGILVPFALLGGCAFGGARLLAGYLSLGGGAELFMIIPAALAYLGLGYFYLGRPVRSELARMFQQVIKA